MADLSGLASNSRKLGNEDAFHILPNKGADTFFKSRS